MKKRLHTQNRVRRDDEKLTLVKRKGARKQPLDQLPHGMPVYGAELAKLAEAGNPAMLGDLLGRLRQEAAILGAKMAMLGMPLPSALGFDDPAMPAAFHEGYSNPNLVVNAGVRQTLSMDVLRQISNLAFHRADMYHENLARVGRERMGAPWYEVDDDPSELGRRYAPELFSEPSERFWPGMPIPSGTPTQSDMGEILWSDVTSPTQSEIDWPHGEPMLGEAPEPEPEPWRPRRRQVILEPEQQMVEVAGPQIVETQILPARRAIAVVNQAVSANPNFIEDPQMLEGVVQFVGQQTGLPPQEILPLVLGRSHVGRAMSEGVLARAPILQESWAS